MKKEVIYIEKGEKVPLPSKYRSANNICAVIYDHLTEIFKDNIYKPLQSTTIKLKDLQDSVAFEKNDLHVLDYLKTNNYNPELSEVLIKDVTLAIVSDMVNFLFESMSCAKRGKMTVAYALLRKPLKDELFLLEMILNDPHQFVDKFFHNGQPASYDPSNVNDDAKRAAIVAAVEKIRPGFFNPDLLFEFRYDKRSNLGISGLSDHALHIVTNNRNYPTRNQNLNFVFSGQAEIDRYWKHYYLILPYLLLYTASVVDGIVFKYLDGSKIADLRDTKIFKRFIGYLLWLDKSFYTSKRESRKILKEFEQFFHFTCEECQYEKQLDRADYNLFFFNDFFVCDECFHTSSFDPEVFTSIISQI